MKQVVTIFESEFGLGAERLLSKLHCAVFKPKSFLIKEGAKELNIYIIYSGSVRFYWDSSEKEHSFDFAFPLDVATDYYSFLHRTAAQFSIQAISKVEAIYLTQNDYFELIQHAPIASAVVCKTLAQALYKKQTHLIDLLSLSPTAHYDKISIVRPQIIKSIPLIYIAAYLGIEPQSLSRIRKQMVSI